MKSFFVVRFTLALLFATAVSSLLAQTIEPPIAPAQRVDLFDGKNLSGWTFATKDTNAVAAAIWSVTNGVIVCQGTGRLWGRLPRRHSECAPRPPLLVPAGTTGD